MVDTNVLFLVFFRLEMAKKKESHHRVLELNADQKILLDAFADLPPEMQRQKLMDILEKHQEELLSVYEAIKDKEDDYREE